MKILHAPTSTGGNSYGLAYGERKLGMDSTVAVFSDTYLNYPADIKLHLNQIPRYYAFLRMLKLFIDSRRKYDIFHFNFGRSIIDAPPYGLHLFDLPLYPKDKKIFVTYNGCDARQKSYSIKNYAITPCKNPLCYDGMCNPKREKTIKKRVKKFNQYAQKIFCLNPDLCNVLSNAKFIPYSIYLDTEDTTIKRVGKTITIVHAPTNREAKGSKYIIDAFNKLREKHHHVNFILVENTPHKEAVKIYQKADVVVDQLLCGWYGGFATEVMAMGKPVVCYVRESDLVHIPKQMAKDLPIINANPNTIQSVLENIIDNPHILKEHGERSIEYYKKWHEPVTVAKKIIEEYES